MKAAFFILVGGIFVIGYNASAKCSIADLTHTGGKGVSDRNKAFIPVVGIRYKRLFGGYFEKR